jgi:hypothetical protein
VASPPNVSQFPATLSRAGGSRRSRTGVDGYLATNAVKARPIFSTNFTDMSCSIQNLGNTEFDFSNRQAMGSCNEKVGSDWIKDFSGFDVQLTTP